MKHWAINARLRLCCQCMKHQSVKMWHSNQNIYWDDLTYKWDNAKLIWGWQVTLGMFNGLLWLKYISKRYNFEFTHFHSKSTIDNTRFLNFTSQLAKLLTQLFVDKLLSGLLKMWPLLETSCKDDVILLHFLFGHINRILQNQWPFLDNIMKQLYIGSRELDHFPIFTWWKLL